MDNILIVDDSILNLTVLRNILLPHYNIITASNGESGLHEAFYCPPSLIVLDIVMNGIDGFEVLTRLKADLRTRDIPVIIITGLQGNGNEERALQYGAVDFITKPFSAGVVLARVNTHIELYRYRRDAERLAMLDELTGIPNRRCFDKQLTVQWQTACKERQHLSIAIADIDYFKGYNDSYGHLAGDNIIRIVARVLQQTIAPAGGFVARVGGEEFSCILPALSQDKAKLLFKEVCLNLELLQLPHIASAAAPYLSISIGGITVSPSVDALNIEAAVNSADQMLYLAKEGGRNTLMWK